MMFQYAGLGFWFFEKGSQITILAPQKKSPFVPFGCTASNRKTSVCSEKCVSHHETESEAGYSFPVGEEKNNQI